MDIKALVESLTPAQIAKLMADFSKGSNVKSVDHTRKLRRIARTNLYFSTCPKPHQVDSFKTYTGHADSIREQVLSGVE
tara:strand:- start:621 stop:857 length:237 start_codon:yes stop_codon:yes gene_type:complete